MLKQNGSNGQGATRRPSWLPTGSPEDWQKLGKALRGDDMIAALALAYNNGMGKQLMARIEASSDACKVLTIPDFDALVAHSNAKALAADINGQLAAMSIVRESLATWADKQADVALDAETRATIERVRAAQHETVPAATGAASTTERDGDGEHQCSPVVEPVVLERDLFCTVCGKRRPVEH